jgi:hypothetical protein
MPTSRVFAFNTGSTISGTEQYGSIAIGVASDVNYTANYGGVRWFMGPDEELGYVIAQSVPSLDQPNPDNAECGVGFFRTDGFNDNGFIEIVNVIASGMGFFTASTDSYNWLISNGYWTSFNPPTPTPTPSSTVIPTLTPTPTPTPTPSSAGGGIVQDSLFMELDASNYTSGTWSDETGNGNNATINGATWSSTDGGIFDLDGINDNIQIAHNSSLSLSTTVQKTIQVWVKFDALGDLNQQIPVFGKLSSSFSFDGYWGGIFSNAGKTRVVTNGTGLQQITDSATNPITTGTWYLYTFMSQITSTSNTTKVYMNTTEVLSTAHGTDGYTESNPLYLGFIGSGVSSTYLNGKIGATYFYTKGLSAAEVTQNYNATKSRYGL